MTSGKGGQWEGNDNKTIEGEGGRPRKTVTVIILGIILNERCLGSDL